MKKEKGPYRLKVKLGVYEEGSLHTNRNTVWLDPVPEAREKAWDRAAQELSRLWLEAEYDLIAVVLEERVDDGGWVSVWRGQMKKLRSP
ncbi:MAG: hypothetical protein WC640_00905 [Candidatus Paceibacterota bacterium]|jgi:hypothetical protein